MARPLGNRGTPYVVRGRYEWAGEPSQEWDSSSHRSLAVALAHVRHVTTAWLRLVGGQSQPLSWHVIDVRDFSEYVPGIASRFGETNGTDEQGRPYARREYGWRERQRGPVGNDRRDRRGGSTGRRV